MVRSRSAWRTGCPYGVVWPGCVEVALPQRRGVDAERGRDPAEHVLDHEHALRPAEPAERGLRRLVRLRDASLGDEVGDPVGVVDVAERAAHDRLREVEAPAAVGGERRREGDDAAVVVEPRLPHDVERMPLAGHREVLRAVEPQPHRAAREHGAERGDRREPVRLHLLAAEAAAHAQRLHGDPVARQAEHVRDDLLRLGRVLRAAVDEHLPLGVDVRERRVRLEVEVLLSADLDDALEDVRRRRERGLGIAAADRAGGALERARLDRLGHGDDRRERLVLDAHGGGTEPGGLVRSRRAPTRGRARGTSPRSGKSGSSCLTPASLTPRHVVGGEHPHDAGHLERRRDVERHEGVRLLRLHRPRREHAAVARRRGRRCTRGARGVQRGALVRQWAGRRRGRRGRAASSLMPAPPRSSSGVRAVQLQQRACSSMSDAVLGARAMVGHRACPRCRARMPRRGRSRRSTVARPARPRWHERGSGWRRRRRARCAREATTPVVEIEREADGDARDVVEASLRDLVEGGDLRQRQRNAHRPDELVGAAHASCGTR